MVILPWDIRRDPEGQVIRRCALRPDCRASRFGIYAVAKITMGPCGFLNSSFICVWTHQPPVEPLPEINLDPFRVCFHRRWRFGELFYISLVIAFGTPSPDLQRHFTPGALTRLAPHSWHRRPSCVLDGFRQSQEIKGE